MKNNSIKALSLVMLSLTALHVTCAPSKTKPLAASHETLAQREQKAFELFMHLLECPLDQVPTWKEFVDKMTHLMEGNPKYAALRASLLSVRDVSGFSGKWQIASVLTEHEHVIPQTIVNKTKELGILEQKKRIKFS